MARLPSRDDLGALPSVRSGRPIARADASAVGQGMAALGSALAGVGAQIDAQDLAAKEFDAERRFQEFKWNEEKALEEAMRSVEPGQADGFAAKWAETYQDRAKEFFSTVPDRLKPKFDAKLFATERSLYGAGANFARSEQRRTSLHALEEAKNRLAQSSDLDRARADYDSLIAKNPFLSPIEKDEIRRKHLDDMEEQNVQWRIGRGDALDEIIRDLQQPGREASRPAAGAGRTSEAGLAFIRGKEGFSAKPYSDYKQTSIGYGTRANPGETAITREEAERRLAAEAGAVSDWIAQNVTVPLTQGQHDALVSFGYNVGTGPEGLGRLLGDINAGEFDRVASRMLTFNRAGGKVDRGLVNRRREEVDLFKSPGSPMLPDEMAAEPKPETDEGGTVLPSGKYIHLSPKRRQALLHNARIALSDVTQRDLKDAAAEAARTGEVPVDANGRTALDRARGILTPNQLSKYRAALDEAVMGFKATAPLADLTEEEAARHLEGLAPSEQARGGESYAMAARVSDRAWKAWAKIRDLRASDPVKAIMGGVIARGAGQGLSVGEDGNIVVRAGDAEDLRLKPAPEVARALAWIRQAKEAERVPAGTSAKLFTSLRTDPIAAQELLIEARLEAQNRLGVIEPRTISREEADALLKMPKGLFKDQDSKAYTDGLKAAADRIYQAYGPKYAKQVFADALAFHLAKKEEVTAAESHMSRLIAEAIDREKRGVGPPSANELREARQGLDRVRNLEEIDRVGRLFEGQGTFPADALSGPGRPAIAPPTAALTGVTSYAAEQAQATARTPTQDEIDWALAKPSRQEVFDKRFGAGAWAREKAKQGQK